MTIRRFYRSNSSVKFCGLNSDTPVFSKTRAFNQIDIAIKLEIPAFFVKNIRDMVTSDRPFYRVRLLIFKVRPIPAELSAKPRASLEQANFLLPKNITDFFSKIDSDFVTPFRYSLHLT